MGRDPKTGMVPVMAGGRMTRRKVKFFAWEELDYVEKIRKAFGL